MRGTPSVLAAEIKRRIGQLLISQRELAEASDVPVATLERLLSGRQERLRSRDAEARLERALGWGPGSMDSVRDGWEPSPIPVMWPAEGRDYKAAVEASWEEVRRNPPSAQNPTPELLDVSDDVLLAEIARRFAARHSFREYLG